MSLFLGPKAQAYLDHLQKMYGAEKGLKMFRIAEQRRLDPEYHYGNLMDSRAVKQKRRAEKMKALQKKYGANWVKHLGELNPKKYLEAKPAEFTCGECKKPVSQLQPGGFYCTNANCSKVAKHLSKDEVIFQRVCPLQLGTPAPKKQNEFEAIG